jgi:transposase
VQRLNRYYRRSRLSEPKFRLLVQHFALDLSAAQAAQLTGLSHRSAITIFGKIRQRVAEECERQSPFKNGEVEVDESYFDPRRVRGRRGRGVGRKTIVFGLLKRDGKVYTEVGPDCKKGTLQAIIRGRVSADAVIHSDGWRGYDGLVDVGYAEALPGQSRLERVRQRGEPYQRDRELLELRQAPTPEVQRRAG